MEGQAVVSVHAHPHRPVFGRFGDHPGVLWTSPVSFSMTIEHPSRSKLALRSWMPVVNGNSFRTYPSWNQYIMIISDAPSLFDSHF
jgi:hypothetical protein